MEETEDETGNGIEWKEIEQKLWGEWDKCMEKSVCLKEGIGKKVGTELGMVNENIHSFFH